MCLTWCHARGLVFDNDLPCSGCPAYGVAVAPYGTARSCATCLHRRAPRTDADAVGEGEPWCGLTEMPLPYAQFCCHHNATPTTQEVILLDEVPVAPWVLAHFHAESVAALFECHHSAPDVDEVGGRAMLRLESLATPLLYGVVAEAWDDSLAVPPPPPIPEPPPHLAFALAILEALQSRGDAATPRAALDALLMEQPLDDIDPYWRSTITETLGLMEEFAREL